MPGRLRAAPAERVRERVRRVAGAAVADRLPSGYQRIGRVLLLRLPAELRPQFPLVGAAWRKTLPGITVLAAIGPVAGEERRPQVEVIAGGSTETEVIEHGIRYRLDAARLLFARGNRTERQRARHLVRAGESVVDLFAGIGYFAIPAALGGATRVVAVERNPVAFRYLTQNVERNGVVDRVEPVLGDNREVPLDVGGFDRGFLGYLPSALPWVARAVPLLRPTGGTLHVHLVADAREALRTSTAAVADSVRSAGASVTAPPRPRIVKPYGPGRTHVVVDVDVRPPAM